MSDKGTTKYAICNVTDCPKYDGGYAQHCKYVDPLSCAVRLKMSHLEDSVSDVGVWMDAYHEAIIERDELKRINTVVLADRETFSRQLTIVCEQYVAISFERDQLKAALAVSNKALELMCEHFPLGHTCIGCGINCTGFDKGKWEPCPHTKKPHLQRKLEYVLNQAKQLIEGE